MADLDVKVDNLTDAINRLVARLTEPTGTVVTTTNTKKPVTVQPVAVQTDRMYLILILLAIGVLVYFFKNYKVSVYKK